MTIGSILLAASAVLVLLGVGQRVLDKMRLSDRAALILIAAMFVGGLIPDIRLGLVRINIGGALIPLGVCVYLLVSADEAAERVRGILGALITAGVVYLLSRVMPSEPENIILDPVYACGVAGGIVGYVLGRSRRGAFISGVMGVLLADLITAIVVWAGGVSQPLTLGGAGIFDTAVISGIIAVLLYLEPHMSATLIILALGFILMTLGGTDWKYLVGLVILGCLLVAVYLLTKGYTGGRISAWLHPENDPLDKGLQVLQSQYAIGSGGLLGLGFGRGRQKYLYLPEEHNDYIFAIACEELGFVGAIGILILFALLIIRGYWIAMHARDRFSMLLAAGLTTLLALQVFLNVAVVTNLLPSTGISLPFFSYGGTALIMQLAENGIVLNVSRSITQSPR